MHMHVGVEGVRTTIEIGEEQRAQLLNFERVPDLKLGTLTPRKG
jgi:hypothetical protein